MNATQIIVFFSGHDFFRLRSEERQRERFDSLADEFLEEFGEPSTDETFALLLKYQADKLEAKRQREAMRLERERAKVVAAGVDSVEDHITKLPDGIYILTAAQNNSKVDPFFDMLATYADYLGARLLIGRMTYNKSAFLQPDVREETWYDPALANYFIEGHIALGEKFHFIADANVIPTARNPISGFEGITPAGINAIIPASKIAMSIAPALKNGETKIITSTGCVTKRNYIMRKTGTIAALEHNHGAVIVNTYTGEIRHIERMEGCDYFYDENTKITVDNVENASEHVAALQLGDVHAEKMESVNWDNALNLIATYRPENVIVHDVLDFSSRNHHNIKDPWFMYNQMLKGNTVENDIATVSEYLADLAVSGAQIRVIESNHDLALTRWLKETDFKDDPVNAMVYLECTLAEYKARQYGDSLNMLQYACQQFGNLDCDNIIFHETDESVVIAGVEMGCHGHVGINGSRGSPAQYRKLGIPLNTGHTHSPGIIGQVYTAGVTASLDMDYNIGPSSWRIAHTITYENGQRQILFA